MPRFLLSLLLSFYFASNAIAKDAVVLIGPPASGKGYIAKRIVEQENFLHISSGDLLRGDTNLSPKKLNMVRSGKLLPDKFIIGIIDKKLSSEESSQSAGFIFDGVPRTYSQVAELDIILKKHRLNLSRVIVINCPDAILYERIEKRFKKEGRADDNPEVLKGRIATYRSNSVKIIEEYRRRGLVEEVNCN